MRRNGLVQVVIVVWALQSVAAVVVLGYVERHIGDLLVRMVVEVHPNLVVNRFLVDFIQFDRQRVDYFDHALQRLAALDLRGDGGGAVFDGLDGRGIVVAPGDLYHVLVGGGPGHLAVQAPGERNPVSVDIGDRQLVIR